MTRDYRPREICNLLSVLIMPTCRPRGVTHMSRCSAGYSFSTIPRYSATPVGVLLLWNYPRLTPNRRRFCLSVCLSVYLYVCLWGGRLTPCPRARKRNTAGRFRSAVQTLQLPNLSSATTGFHWSHHRRLLCRHRSERPRVFGLQTSGDQQWPVPLCCWFNVLDAAVSFWRSIESYLLVLLNFWLLSWVIHLAPVTVASITRFFGSFVIFMG